MLKRDVAIELTRDALSSGIDVDRVTRAELGNGGSAQNGGFHVVSGLRVIDRLTGVAKLVHYTWQS